MMLRLVNVRQYGPEETFCVCPIFDVNYTMFVLEPLRSRNVTRATVEGTVLRYTNYKVFNALQNKSWTSSIEIVHCYIQVANDTSEIKSVWFVDDLWVGWEIDSDALNIVVDFASEIAVSTNVNANRSIHAIERNVRLSCFTTTM